MQHRQLWYRGGLGLALALVVVGYRGSRTVIRAVPRAQLSVDQKMPSTSSVFSASKLTLQDEANNSALQVSPEAQESAGPDKQSDLISGSSTSSSSSGSTILGNVENNQTSKTATTKAAEMVNGTVKMTLDTNGTLHLSGGSFGASLGSATGSWIVKTLTANGYQPTQVSKIVIYGKITATTMTNYSYLFANLPNVTAIDGLANLNLTGVTDISWLFLNCSQLGALDLNSWDVSSVIRMEGTFQNCTKLVTLNVANWNTDSLQYLIDTFNGDSSLTSLPVGKWNTSKVATMMRTFTDCSSLTSLDVANWDTRVVTNMSAIFRGMSKVKNLPIDKWQTGRVVVNMQLAFSGDTSLESINVSNWDTSRAAALDGTFAKLPNIKSLPLDNWNTSNVQTLRNTFYGDTNLTQLPIDNWNVGKVFDFNSTFSGCASLTTAPVANWNTQSATNLGYTFEGMTSLTSLPVDNWQTGIVTNMAGTFSRVSQLKSLPISKWNTKNVQNMAGTFSEMSSVTALPVDNWQTGNVTTMREIFTKVSQVKNLPVGKWNTAKVVDMGQVFYGNPQLTSLPIENWNTSSATDFSQLFAEDSGLQTLNLGTWNTTKVTNFESVFQNTSLDKLDLTGWNTNSAQTYTNAFSSKLPPKRLLLGPSFNFFKSERWQLPNPSSEAPYIGKWRSLNNKKVYTSADLMTKYDGKTIVGEFEWATGDAYHIKPIEIQGYVPDQPDGVQGNFTDKDEMITLVYNPGGLLFASAPQTINFGQNPITGKLENYGASYDTGLVIQDGRPIGSMWSLNATLSASGFTSKQSVRPLAAVLSYKDQQTGSESILAPGVARLIVKNHQTVSNQGVNVLGQKTALGALSLQVPTDRALTDTYQATVTWTLNQGVPNR
ncbi:BspA family leucine-rich repeat surface protein [Lactiplantibacillus plantarum]|uniref:BspA family leucine-rich repeat surface protein n=1 Tax=Lactiplantibacillus plantarum TaxID=1590 RepID=UPI0012F70EC8|nr:BspA family leucine-rich repeat surface protein [Lactiplantibacillus plantarum]QGX69974.1 BspA family leucine-rich repeat surface protein [Lactiplantibacillus plantarum]